MKNHYNVLSHNGNANSACRRNRLRNLSDRSGVFFKRYTMDTAGYWLFSALLL